ncbi:MAG: hypothetical protein MJ134_00510 [Lachnospiraceae bacterium]|nr:hypothetical protein [Lachnospiraceae bacterium]
MSLNKSLGRGKEAKQIEYGIRLDENMDCYTYPLSLIVERIPFLSNAVFRIIKTAKEVE